MVSTYANCSQTTVLDLCLVGKTFPIAKHVDMKGVIEVFRYYASWAGKSSGKTIEVCDQTFSQNFVDVPITD
jgi:hypothetical protein